MTKGKCRKPIWKNLSSMSFVMLLIAATNSHTGLAQNVRPKSDHSAVSVSMQEGLEPPRKINRANLSEEDISHISLEARSDRTEQAYQSLLWALSIIPRDIKQRLWQKNVQIILCDSIAGYKQRAGAKPFHGSFNRTNWTWNNLSGFTQGKKVVVGESFLKNRPIKSPGKTLLHELGHAFDFTNACTKRQLWKESFQVDAAAQTEKKYKWADKEVYAQLFSWEIRRRAHELRKTDKDYDISTRMRNCWIVVANDIRQSM